MPTPPRRVVTIGAAGFVGGAILARLKSLGVDCLALARTDVDLLAPDASQRLATLLRADDSVVFVSARAPAKTVAMLMENLRIVEAVSDALASRPVTHLLNISSDAIYADDSNPVTEASYAAPSTTHGMMHAARELMLRSAVPIPCAMLRPTLIYGAADPHGGYGPNRFRREADAGGPIKIFGEGEERRDHIAIDDVAELASLILLHRSRGGLNAATGVATSFYDIAQALAAHYGPAMRVQSLPRPGPRPHLLHRHFDVAAVYKAFPRFRFTPLADGLRKLRG
jgi:nucleoside-diphosphate-sugar epimerase